MTNELNAITNGTFTLAESEEPNVFYFYRNDKEVIGDVGGIPMDFYQNWLCMKMFTGKITKIVMNNICFETSTDGKSIKLTVSETGECKPPKKKPNLFKRILYKILK